jgi:hypothetical protein
MDLAALVALLPRVKAVHAAMAKDRLPMIDGFERLARAIENVKDLPADTDVRSPYRYTLAAVTDEEDVHTKGYAAIYRNADSEAASIRTVHEMADRLIMLLE